MPCVPLVERQHYSENRPQTDHFLFRLFESTRSLLVMMFAYLLGPILFGWYGFFLLPIVFIVILEAIRIVLPKLVRSKALTSDISLG